MTWAVRFEEVGKRYPGGAPRYASFREDLARLGRKAVAFRRPQTVEPPDIRALDAVSFEVQDGEAFALVGPNGAGKTTALKLLARISRPTWGRVRFRGRVGALIDVGSGIHPELTGRENVWLYGSIMGMSKAEIARRFDDIVDFAELAHVLDLPVKMYSSGMQLRLGFAVASHIDPDIFIVDEALAVGDASFQAKCVERMMHLISEGRTLLFVSHNLPAVEAICRRGLFLREGRVVAVGSIREVLRKYLDWTDKRTLTRWRERPKASNDSAMLEVLSASCHSVGGTEQYEFGSDDPVEIRIRFRAKRPLVRPNVNLGITDGRPGLLIHCSTLIRGNPPEYVVGEWTAVCRIARLNLMPRLYQVWCDVYTEHGHGVFCEWQEVTAFRVEASSGVELDGKLALTVGALGGALKSDFNWTHTVSGCSFISELECVGLKGTRGA